MEYKEIQEEWDRRQNQTQTSIHNNDRRKRRWNTKQSMKKLEIKWKKRHVLFSLFCQ